MKSHAVSGPNKKKQPTPLLERRDANSCLRKDPTERSFRKALLCLWAHGYLGHPFLGIRFSGMGNDRHQKMSLMPVSVSQRFPNFCCQVLVILLVASPHSGPGCSACQNSSHPTSGKLTLVSHDHMPFDVFALSVKRERAKIKPAHPHVLVQLCGVLSSPGMDQM